MSNSDSPAPFAPDLAQAICESFGFAHAKSNHPFVYADVARVIAQHAQRPAEGAREEVKRWKMKCDECHGIGKDSWGSECEWCEGTGQVTVVTGLPAPDTAEQGRAWTKEPLCEGRAGSSNIITYDGEDANGIAFVRHDATRARIIACYNALQSIDDPAGFVRQARIDSANYRGKCGACATACCDMLTDDHCAACKHDAAAARVVELERDVETMKSDRCKWMDLANLLVGKGEDEERWPPGVYVQDACVAQLTALRSRLTALEQQHSEPLARIRNVTDQVAAVFGEKIGYGLPIDGPVGCVRWVLEKYKALEASAGAMREAITTKHGGWSSIFEYLQTCYDDGCEDQDHQAWVGFVFPPLARALASTPSTLTAEREALRRALAEHTRWKPGIGIIAPIKPNHGPCCTCQECGQHHDDCVCEHNAIERQITAALDGGGQ